MSVRICVAGATGWAGSQVVRRILASTDFQLTGAIARRAAGQDVGEALGLPAAGVRIAGSLAEALVAPADVLIDYTGPDSIRARTLEALDRGVRVIVGTSGLAAADYAEIAQRGRRVRAGRDRGRQLLDHRGVGEALRADRGALPAVVGDHRLCPCRQTRCAQRNNARAGRSVGGGGAERVGRGDRADARPAEARGANIAGTQVHSVRLPGYVIAFETIFGLPDERLTIRHDAGAGAEPYVAGTLLAAERVMDVTGLVRGLDTLLFR